MSEASLGCKVSPLVLATAALCLDTVRVGTAEPGSCCPNVPSVFSEHGGISENTLQVIQMIFSFCILVFPDILESEVLDDHWYYLATSVLF